MSLLDDIKKIASEISKRRKYVHGDKGVLETYHKQLKQWQPENKIGKTGRIAGLGTIDISWFLFCLGKYLTKDLNTVFLDNRIIDKFKQNKENQEIKNTDSQFNSFFKELQKSYPLAAARLQLWMLYALFTGLVIGGAKISHKDKENSNDLAQEIIIDNPEENAVEDVVKTYNPQDENFAKNFIEDNWNDIVIGLLEFETYNENPKKHTREKRYTYGPGLTWVYIDGEQYPCTGKYKDMVENFSDIQIWDQVKQHCLYKTECMQKIKKSLIKHGITEISAQQLVALLLAGYQHPTSINGIVHKLKNAGDNEQKKADSFIAGTEVRKDFQNGTNKRRWWCAMLYTENITIEDLLQMDRDAFSEIKLATIKNKNHFIFNDDIIQNALNCEHITNSSVQDFILSRRIFGLGNKKVNKVISFNQGIKNIKNKQKQNNIMRNLNNEYHA